MADNYICIFCEKKITPSNSPSQFDGDKYLYAFSKLPMCDKCMDKINKK